MRPAPSSTCAAWWRSGRARPGRPAQRPRASTSRAQLSAIGLTATEQPFVAQTPLGPVKMANVIARIPGARAERLILASHYDTKLFRQFRFVGANDGGSSTALLLELGARAARRARTRSRSSWCSSTARKP